MEVFYSGENKPFYVKAGTEEWKEPNNISINAGANRYYLVNDYSYVLIHETTFFDPEETDAAAEAIVESFRWPEN